MFDVLMDGQHVAWLWIAGGVLLCAAEMLVPGVFLFWIGLAAMATGAVLLLQPLSLALVLLLFGLAAIVFMLLGRAVYGSLRKTEARPFLNQRAEGLVGKLFVLDQPIVNVAGRIRVDDSIWRIAGPDAAAGARVKVVAVEGGVLLRVEIV